MPKNYLPRKISDLARSFSAFTSALTKTLADKQDLSEKGAEDGYCELNADGVVPATRLGQVLEEFSVKHHAMQSFVPQVVSITADNELPFTKATSQSGHVWVEGYQGSTPVIDFIRNEGWDFVDGDSIVVQNGYSSPLVIHRGATPAPFKVPLEFVGTINSTKMLVPVNASFIARYDAGLEVFQVVPLWKPEEENYQSIDILAPSTITNTNYSGYMGKVLYVAAAVITINDVPHGFHATFIASTGTDVSFASSVLTLQNRQSHTKIAGQWGVVTVRVDRNYDYLILSGDTKA